MAAIDRGDGMNVLQSASAVVLRWISKARRFKPVAVFYACLPKTFKLRITRGLLQSAVGTEQLLGATDTARILPSRLPPREIAPQFAGQGVNLCGYVRGQFGLGESTRLFAAALTQSHYPFTLMDFEIATPGRSDDVALAEWIVARPEYSVSAYFVNPDQMLRAHSHFEAQRREARYVVGYWFWELQRFPEAWRGAFEFVDEIWVASEFVRGSVAAATDKPVQLMPLPLHFPLIHAWDRASAGLMADHFLFLCTFDYYSYPQRKNPEAVIAAFRAAFPRKRDDVRLLIKTVNADRVADSHLRLIDAAGGDSRILFRDGHLGREAMYGLIAAADSYVSLHRSEGFGLGMAEAMYFGKPVIATAYSGNMDFMREDEDCLVGYHLRDVMPGAYPHGQGQQWAEPDVGQAADYMRRLADNPGLATARGTAAMRRIQRQYAPSICAASMIDRLRTLSTGKTVAADVPRTNT